MVDKGCCRPVYSCSCEAWRLFSHDRAAALGTDASDSAAAAAIAFALTHVVHLLDKPGHELALPFDSCRRWNIPQKKGKEYSHANMPLYPDSANEPAYPIIVPVPERTAGWE